MKKQNVNNKLAFTKAAVAELNELTMIDVNGGTGHSSAYVTNSITTIITTMGTVPNVLD